MTNLFAHLHKPYLRSTLAHTVGCHCVNSVTDHTTAQAKVHMMDEHSLVFI